jgi:hypothetical protein
MGSCLAVEVREQPAQYYDRSGQPRHTVVRQRNKSAYRRSDESSLYRPRSRLSIRHDDYRSQDDFRVFDTRQDDYNDQYRSPAQAEYRNERRFVPLPPPAPPPQLIQNDPFRNNNLLELGGMVELGGHQPNNHNEIQIIDNPVEIVPRPPRSHRGHRQMVVHPSRRGGQDRRYYDDSDDDSWVERRPRSGYSDDFGIEVYRSGRRRSSRRRSRSRSRSRSRNNSRYHR